jgi:hypothetical protein
VRSRRSASPVRSRVGDMQLRSPPGDRQIHGQDSVREGRQYALFESLPQHFTLAGIASATRRTSISSSVTVMTLMARAATGCAPGPTHARHQRRPASAAHSRHWCRAGTSQIG